MPGGSPTPFHNHMSGESPTSISIPGESPSPGLSIGTSRSLVLSGVLGGGQQSLLGDKVNIREKQTDLEVFSGPSLEITLVVSESCLPEGPMVDTAL